MDHIVYLDYKAKELDHILAGTKTMLIRGAMGRKIPYGKVENGDTLFFVENNGDGLIKAKAIVSDVFNSEKLTPDESLSIINRNQHKLLLDKGLMKRFGGKRYLVLITIEHVVEVENFKFDKTNFSNMDDWLPVGDINNVKI